MKVLVLGGSGFIGSRLMAAHPDWDNLDLKNNDDLTDGFEGGYDFVVFLAAHLNHSREDYNQNLAIYSAVSDYLTYNKTYVIYTSSAAVYRDSFVGHSEKEIPMPETIYGKSKLLGELVIQDIADSYTILRLANVYGDGSGRGVIDRFKRGKTIIYGDGEQVRDYIPVETVVTVIDRIMANPKLYNKETYNLGSGVGKTVKEVFNEYGRGEIIYQPPRSFDVEYSVLVTTKAKNDGLL